MKQRTYDLILAFLCGILFTMIVLNQHSSECQAGYEYYLDTGSTDKLSDECLADM